MGDDMIRGGLRGDYLFERKHTADPTPTDHASYLEGEAPSLARVALAEIKGEG